MLNDMVDRHIRGILWEEWRFTNESTSSRCCAGLAVSVERAVEVRPLSAVQNHIL